MKYYYSNELKSYIGLEPLRISGQVMHAAEELGIHLTWDDDGYLCNITLEEAKWLTEALGGFMLSPSQYWQVYKEALDNGQEEVKNSLTAHYFTEFLDRVYYSADEYIDHAKAVGGHQFEGGRTVRKSVAGRPGWILFDDIDLESGVPFRVREKGEGDSGLMKYWDPDVSVSPCKTCCAIRGYVTSVDQVSLDLGIPVESRQPKLMIRFCTKNKPEDFLLPEEYALLNDALSDHSIEKLEKIVSGPIFAKLSLSGDHAEIALRERITATLGYERIQANRKGTQCITYEELLLYMQSCCRKIHLAAEQKKRIVFVVGHRNPDSDTVVSSMMEAFRLSTCYGSEEVVYSPLIQAEEMPEEIRKLLGDALSDAVIFENRIPLQEWIEKGLVRFVYTDQNYQKEYQKYVIAVTDHHAPASALAEREPAYSFLVESVGSATSLVVKKLQGHGFEPDQAVARILYGAMLMDTELRVPHKMTVWDVTVMDRIRQQAGITDDAAFYSSLMERLLHEKDWKKLYYRDYKSFQGYDFAEMKVVDFLGDPTCEATLPAMIAEAKKNNLSKNTYMTIVKITQYFSGGRSIERERIYTIFHESVQQDVREKVVQLLQEIIKLHFKDAVIITEHAYMEVRGVGKQLSRKQIAPALEKLLYYMNQYVYIESLGKWVCRDFMKLSDAVSAADPDVLADEKLRICNLSFKRAKELLGKLGLEMLDVREYWAVYDEAVQKNDKRLLDSLTDCGFIEYLDTGAVDGMVIHHPVLEKDGRGRWTMHGLSTTEDAIPAKPGLIDPAEIDRETGLPKIVHHPAEYENRSLWRYWSPPDTGNYVFSRSFIFLLGQVCLDAKMSLHEGFANLGVRPVRRSELKTEIRFETENGCFRMYYKGEGDLSETVVYEVVR